MMIVLLQSLGIWTTGKTILCKVNGLRIRFHR